MGDFNISLLTLHNANHNGMLEAKIVKKYSTKSIPNLIATATKYFNAFIRNRDANLPCISSGKWVDDKQAGHFYSAGNYPELRFDEDNVHGQRMSDNYFKSGNLLAYRKNLIRRIGQARVDRLDAIAQLSKKQFYKWDRFFLIQIIEIYKDKSRC